MILLIRWVGGMYVPSIECLDPIEKKYVDIMKMKLKLNAAKLALGYVA